jgi:hypothetical protein
MADTPQHFLCPITQELMHDPVIGPDGHTYEREAITNWLQTNPYSPVSRIYMPSHSLIPNIALRDSIEQYLASHASHPAPSSASSIDLTFHEQPIDIKTNIYSMNEKKHLHVKLMPPSTDNRQPILFIPIIDNSGSMGEPADSDEKIEGTGGRRFSRLDIVKFTIQVLIEVMNEKDSIAIVTFSTSARVILPVTLLNPAGKARALRALQEIQPDSQTNIYDGIRQASRLANAPELAGRHICAMLLTDGLPNVHPPRPMMDALTHYIKMKNPWTLHTFGFGYNLDSALLEKIAGWGHGLFGFISDCSMVGNVFIHSLANMLATAVPNYSFTYSVNGVEFVKEIGPIILGQNRDVIIELPGSAEGILVNNSPVEENPVDIIAHTHYEYITVIKSAIDMCKEGRLDSASDELLRFHVTKSAIADPIVSALMRDISSSSADEGQIGMSPRYFKKWGEHYMRSYVSAQQLQQAMNFKDPGLQIYGGDLFKAIKDVADEKFNDLPVPTPSLGMNESIARPQIHAPAPVSGTGLPQSAPTLAPTFSMGMAYNNAHSGACFAGQCLVRMADDSHKKMSELIRGDSVWTPSGPANIVARVTCHAVKQQCVQLKDLIITPWHPVLYKGQWQYPIHLLKNNQFIELDTVFNLVLDKHHIIHVEGYDCITLAHNLTDPVVAHPYFGTDAILKDLEVQTGWDTGIPTFQNLIAKRDPDSGLICKWTNSIK